MIGALGAVVVDWHVFQREEVREALGVRTEEIAFEVVELLPHASDIVVDCHEVALLDATSYLLVVQMA